MKEYKGEIHKKVKKVKTAKIKLMKETIKNYKHILKTQLETHCNYFAKVIYIYPMFLIFKLMFMFTYAFRNVHVPHVCLVLMETKRGPSDLLELEL